MSDFGYSETNTPRVCEFCRHCGLLVISRKDGGLAESKFECWLHSTKNAIVLVERFGTCPDWAGTATGPKGGK